MKNFFEHQDQARKMTAYLIFLFFCAITGTIFALYIALIWADIKVTGSGVALWKSEYVIVASVIVGLTVGFGSLSKTQSLRGGGAVVASSLGGQAVSLDTTDPQLQSLLNVVSEMAIAAGVAVPSVYVLPDRGINAFAAGLDANNAVIGVTQGTLDQLTRDQLQGVIAHEFSHIVNGDMALNLKLMGLLHGLLLLHIAGRHILFPARRVRRASRNRDGFSPVHAVGLGLLLGGGIGWIFGLLIKSAVSRQREYLADASAVQFTRNTNGITDALRRIATMSSNSARIDSPNAEAASHLFFNQLPGLGAAISLLATHPSLASRIRRLSGGLTLPPLEHSDLAKSGKSANSAFSSSVEAAPSHHPLDQSAALPIAAAITSAAVTSDADASLATVPIPSPTSVTEQIGIITPDHLRHAQALLNRLSDILHKAARSQTKAWLQGLSPKDNRTIPPLRYSDVHRLKRDFPHLYIEINGGFKTLDQVRAQLLSVDAVMIGRAAYDTPYLFATADQDIFGDLTRPVQTRHQIVQNMLPYIADWTAKGVRLHSITRHLLHLFHGQPGSRIWKRTITEGASLPGASVQVVKDALSRVCEAEVAAAAHLEAADRRYTQPLSSP